MNNYQRNGGRGGRRIGAKQQNVNRTARDLIITAIIWIVYILDEILVAHNSILFVIVVSLGIWGVGLLISKPGKFAKKAYEIGFWNAVFNRSPRGRRGRGRNYRR